MPESLGKLSDLLCEQLELPADERLVLLGVSPASVSLGRVGPGDPDLPDAAPDLAASLEILPLASVLRALHDARRSGWLRLRYREHEKSVWLHRGEVVFATSNQRVDRLGECLLRAGVLQLGMLREAERAFQGAGPGDRFGKILVERGFLTPRELWNGVKYQVEEIVRSLFAYASGQVWFWDGDRQPDNVVRLSLDTARLVEEGLQRSEELEKFLTVLRDPRVSLARAPGHRAELAGNERALADAIGAGRRFDEVCRVLDFDPVSAARSIQLLRLVGAVQLMRLPEEAAHPIVDAAGMIPSEPLRQRATQQVKAIAELAAWVADADGGETAVLDRLRRVLDEATGHFPALLTGVAIGPGATLDVDLLLDRATKLPGERDGQLMEALGELVSYLEFEVKNHPAIEAPEDRLRELRQSVLDA